MHIAHSSAAALVTIVLAASWVLSGAACAHDAGALRTAAARDARGWMPDVQTRLERLVADARAGAAAPPSAAAGGRDQPPRWWLPCPPPEQVRP